MKIEFRFGKFDFFFEFRFEITINSSGPVASAIAEIFPC